MKTLKNSNVTSIVTSLGGLVLVVVVLGILTHGAIFSGGNLQTIMNQSYSLIILSAGVTFIIAHGGIDFSCASVAAVSAMVIGMLNHAGCPLLLAGVVGVIAAILLSSITGILTVLFNVPAFIASLCMMNIGRGLVVMVIANNPVKLAGDYSVFRSWGLKLAVLVVLLFVAYILMNHTLVGRYNKAIGANPIAASQGGVAVKKYRLIAYAFSGLCIGVASFFLLCRNPIVTTNFANGLQLEVLVAVMLGGMAPKGGYRASVRCAITGSLIIGFLSNGLVILGVNDQLIEGIEGLVFLVTVLIFYSKDKDSVFEWFRINKQKKEHLAELEARQAQRGDTAQQ